MHEWVDARLPCTQAPLSAHERAVAVRKLIECTSTRGYEGAVDTAHGEIVRLRAFKAGQARRAAARQALAQAQAGTQ